MRTLERELTLEFLVSHYRVTLVLVLTLMPLLGLIVFEDLRPVIVLFFLLLLLLDMTTEGSSPKTTAENFFTLFDIQKPVMIEQYEGVSGDPLLYTNLPPPLEVVF